METQLTTEFLAGIFERWLDSIEQAVDAHDTLTRRRHGAFRSFPDRATLIVDRNSTDNALTWTAGIRVRLESQRKMSDLRESADTPEEAVEKLIKNLDIWAKAIDK
jgi:hypothetical protein